MVLFGQKIGRLILGMLLAPLLAMGQQREKPYNVLFIVVDDLRPSLGCYGDRAAITPHIDRLAARSIVFDRAYCQQAVCNPSRASVLTGLRPDENGVTDLITHFREKLPNAVTLPQAFKNAGYTAVGVGKIFHGSKNTQDTASWSAPPVRSVSVKSSEYFLEKNKKGGKADAYEFVDAPEEAYPDGRTAATAIQLLTTFKQSGKPFFLATGFQKPHLPFCAPLQYWDLHAGLDTAAPHNPARPAGAPALAYHQWQELRGYTDIADKGPLGAQQARDLKRAYYACVSYMDAQLGKVLDALDRLGLRENTLVVLWGDHGYHLGEQDLWCKSTNFELDTRIPLLIAAPGVVRVPATTPAIVEAVDLYPTLLELCQIQPAGPLSGASLVPLLKDPEKKWTGVAYSQFCRPYKAITSKTATHMGYSVRDQNWRYTLWYEMVNNRIVARELYDLSSHPIETENLAGGKAYRKTERKLERLLQRYRQPESHF